MLDGITSVCPAAPVQELESAAQRFGIDSPRRLAHWVAQLGHESGGFVRLVENLNYRAQALVRTFPSRFPDLSVASAYAHKPEAIANRVYSNRLGNADEASGDGWAFRGRGFIQITGRANYEACSVALFGDARLIQTPALLEQVDTAAGAAGWFWSVHFCNRYADHDDINGVSGIVNRGDPHKTAHGLADRMLWLDRCKHALGVS